MTQSFRIYPAIGIARVGNSHKAFYYGPETYLGMPTEMVRGKEKPIKSFRDHEKRVKRQAARFYLYSFDDSDPDRPGEPVVLGKDGVSDVEWTVHLANKKPVWYGFDQMEGQYGYAPTHELRNPTVTDPEKRRQLMIDPGPRSVSRSIERASFSRGSGPPGYPESFPPKGLEPFEINSLGEIIMEAGGSLVVLGGHGNSGSSAAKPKIKTYANNDGWWDDTSDGPVTATVTLNDGTKVAAQAAAWVVVAPPAYAPQIPNMVNLYDVMSDVVVRHLGHDERIFKNGLWQGNYRPDFDTEIKPILERPEMNKWVSTMPPSAHLFPYRDLGDPDPKYQPWRQKVLETLRKPNQVNVAKDPLDRKLMPYLCGENPFSHGVPSKFLALTDTDFFRLSQWAKGKFIAGDSGKSERIPPDPPYDALTKAILQNCVGGAFCPGIETSWLVCNPNLYVGPFRIRHREATGLGLGLGQNLSFGIGPGDLTKYMALPWQADFNECSDQTIDGEDIYWWPAQRPFEVRLADFQTVRWSRGIPENDPSDDIVMVTQWKNLGFLKNVGPSDEPFIIEVERNNAAFGEDGEDV